MFFLLFRMPVFFIIFRFNSFLFMLPSSLLKMLTPSPWRSILRKNFTCVKELADFLELTKEQQSQLILRPNFSLQVPLRLAKKMKKGTLDDPLLIQFLPLSNELESAFGFSQDPVCDVNFKKENKLLHKYHGRVLLVCTSACAMHCRYCFRQNFNYDSTKGFERELHAIGEDSSIQEVILSGGDPLSLSDEILDDVFSTIAQFQHVKKVRFHTRFPIGIPERIDDHFLKILEKVPQQIYFVIHCNHPKELDRDIFDSLKKIQALGGIILNQAVLLKGVNDRIETLKELAEKLSNHGIIFYYLHQLDRVKGAAHFEVSEETGKKLVAELAKLLPGYAVPKYVREIPGEPNKTLI